MNPDKIPLELRQRPQWVVWRTILSLGGEKKKPPYNPKDPNRPAEVDDPTTWGTFEEAMACYAANQSLFSGLGYVFTGDDEFFGIDVDDEAAVKPDHLPMRRRIVQELLENVVTYTEVSPSGTGLHFIAKGKLPPGVDGKRSTPLQLEIYNDKRYFTITGNTLEGRDRITDQQAFLHSIFTEVFNTQGRVTERALDTFINRRTDLSDEEVIRLATNFTPTFAPRYNAQQDCEPGEWSETFMMVVGTLDRFTGLVDQVERLVMQSPMVLNAKPAPNGELRVIKARRTFQTVLSRVRHGNNSTLHFVEHGRQQFENIQRAKAEEAQKANDELIRQAGQAALSGKVWEAFPMLRPEHRELSRPQGVIGQFVEACELAMHVPYTKFAIPATFAALAGVIGRGYKLERGKGINVNFIMAAPTGAGKTEATSAWGRFMSQAANAIGNDLSGQSKSPIINNGTSSIQGIYEDFMALPSMCWTIEECASQLKAMASGATPVEAQLRDAYNMLYDCAEHDRYFSPPRSVANRKANYDPINNLAVSTCWTTTTSKFDIQDGDALDGFLSRVVIVRHEGKAGERQRYPQTLLAGHLFDKLCVLLANAKRLNETYEISARDAGQMITTISTEAIADLKWSLLGATDELRNAALAGHLPAAYASVSRLPVTAERIAGIMAVIENPYTPAVTVDQYLWAFSYLLQNATSLLSDMEAGELGTKASDETLAVVRAYRALIERFKRPPAGVRKTDLRKLLVDRKPFNAMGEKGRSPSKAVTETFTYMLTEGMLAEIDEPGATSSRQRLLTATDDPIWKQ